MKDSKLLKIAKELAETYNIADNICRSTMCYKCNYKDYGIDYCIYAMQVDIIKGRKNNGKRSSNSSN